MVEIIKGGIRARTFIPNGMTKPIAKRFWKQARFEATLTMKKLAKSGVTDDWSEEAKEALQQTLAIMRSPMSVKDRLQAAKQVLEWTQAKPVAKSQITINKAEEWLETVTEQNEEADEGTDTDSQAAS